MLQYEKKATFGQMWINLYNGNPPFFSQRAVLPVKQKLLVRISSEFNTLKLTIFSQMCIILSSFGPTVCILWWKLDFDRF